MSMGVTVKYLPPADLRGSSDGSASWVAWAGSRSAGSNQQIRGHLSRSERKSQGGGIGGDWVAGDHLEACIDARIDEYFGPPVDYKRADKAVHLEQMRLGGKNWRAETTRPGEAKRRHRKVCVTKRHYKNPEEVYRNGTESEIAGRTRSEDGKG